MTDSDTTLFLLIHKCERQDYDDRICYVFKPVTGLYYYTVWRGNRSKVWNSDYYGPIDIKWLYQEEIVYDQKSAIDYCVHHWIKNDRFKN